MKGEDNMPFYLPKGCRTYFSGIFDEKNKDGTKLKLHFDGYYFCLMAGLATGYYSNNAEFESSELIDYYPTEYLSCKDYIAGLLIATEAKLEGIEKSNEKGMEQLMVKFIDSQSKTSLKIEGENRLNQYAAHGLASMVEHMNGPHINLSSFLLDYWNYFKEEKFLRD